MKNKLQGLTIKPIRLLYYIPAFVVFYLSKLVQSNIQMAFVILSPKMKIGATFVEYPINVTSTAGLLLLSNLISMTPGTLSADMDANHKKLRVHVLSNSNTDTILNEIANIERQIIRLIY